MKGRRFPRPGNRQLFSYITLHRKSQSYAIFVCARFLVGDVNAGCSPAESIYSK
jgi:hypothetical protein